MKIALACSGIGQVQRGFERLFLDLFACVKDEVDITLFKGGGPARPDEVVVWNTPRHAAIHRRLPLPLHLLTRKPPYYQECWSFALGLWPRLMLGGYDLVHVIDIPTAQALGWIQRATRSRMRTLYTQGVVVAPRWCPRADHIHQVAEPLLQEGLAYGHAAERMTLIPCGVHAARLTWTPRGPSCAASTACPKISSWCSRSAP